MSDKEWEEKCNLYIKIHDAVVKDNEKLYIENVRLKDAVLAEREACAQVCESLENDMVSGKRTKDGDQAALTAAILSERIRARGQHD